MPRPRSFASPTRLRHASALAAAALAGVALVAAFAAPASAQLEVDPAPSSPPADSRPEAELAPSSPAPSPREAASGGTSPLTFEVRGTADVRTGIRGRVVINGSFDGTYDERTGSFAGALTLTPTIARVTALGVMPLSAETDWTFTEPVTGQWRDGVMTVRIAAKIRHPRMWLAGWLPLPAGPACETRQPSVIELTSTAPVSSAQAGGTLATTGRGFAISAFQGCGAFTAFISAVAAGSGSQATLQLIPRAG